MSSLFLAWRRLFAHPEEQDSRRIQDIHAWQKTLLEEHEGLRDELELLLRTYVRTVDRFVERANELTPEQYEREQEAVESIRKILQNAIRRLEVSCKDHRELLDEWHEWVAFRRAAEQKHELESAHRERVEMIRSELSVRGIAIEDPVAMESVRSVDSRSVSEPTAPVSSALERSAMQYRREPVLDDLSDWKALRQSQIEPEWRAAEEAWRALSSQAHVHPERAVELLKRLKEAHGDLRLLDRTRRERRYRLQVFSVG